MAAIAVLLAATLQSEHLFGIIGIRPNLTLVTLIVLSFFIEDLALYCLLILLGCIGIHFTPGISRETVALALVALAGFLVKERAVWPGVSGTAILIFFGTVGIYGAVAPAFLYQHPLSVLFEAVYNIVLGLVLYELTSMYVKKTRLTI